MQDLRTTAAIHQDEPKYFLIWIAVWIVALTVLLPNLA
jgi:hypothetical protein